jgi:lipopolysaccharide transport system ATP-binding protein
MVISVENLSKRYRLGQIGVSTFQEAIAHWYHRLRGRNPDDHLGKIVSDRVERGEGVSLEHAEEQSEPESPSGAADTNTVRHVKNDHIWALRDVSFKVREGEVLGIIGRNGAGKSTLLKILTRITEPTSGRARLRGRTASLLEVGTGFHPELTGRENVFLNGTILGMRRREIDARFDAIVDFSGIEPFIDTPVKRYSSGMYVRLAFAVAAHLEPDILLVDEVLAVGDVAFQRRCLGRMAEIGREGRTIIYVSHNMASVINLCGRAILLEDGQIAAHGRPSEVVESYLSLGRCAEHAPSWDDPECAPGNGEVRLRSVRVLQDEGQRHLSDVDIGKDTSIEITYWVVRNKSALYPAIILTDAVGTVVFASNNFRNVSSANDPWAGKEYDTGVYQSVCVIPGNFLNEGRYNVTVVIGRRPSTTIIQQEEIVSFAVCDTGEMRQEYYGGWAGVIRPKLAWHTVKTAGDGCAD